MSNSNNLKKIGVLPLAMIIVSAIVSLRNFPFCAQYGMAALGYLIVAAITFFVPTAEITAELSTSFPGVGGIYHWVRLAFGPRFAFITLWLGWLGTVTWFPAILIFSAAMVTYLLNYFVPVLNLGTNNLYFTFFYIIVAFWGITFINLKGLKFSSTLGSISGLLGIVLPTILMIGAGLYYWANDITVFSQHTKIASLSLGDINTDNIAIFAVILLGFAGAELVSFHINDTKDPAITYPKALLLATFVIVAAYVLGTWSMLIIVEQPIRITDGVLQIFAQICTQLQFSWGLPVIAFALFLGSLAGVSSWVIGPAKGMLAAAEDQFLPQQFNIVNSNGVPVNLLYLQALIGTLLTVVFFLFSKHSDEFLWIFSAMSFQFLALQYIIIFITAIRLRKKFANVIRIYKVKLLNLKSYIGVFVCCLALLASFFPPSGITEFMFIKYLLLLLLCLFVLMLPAYFFISRNVK